MAEGLLLYSTQTWLGLPSYLNLLKLYWAKQSHVCSPLWKRGFVAGSSQAHPRHVSAGHCFSLHVVCLSFQNIVISFRLLLRPSPVHFHSQCRTSTAVRSHCEDHPRTHTHTFIGCLIRSFPPSLSLLYGCKTSHTSTHKTVRYPNRRIIILAFIFHGGKNYIEGSREKSIKRVCNGCI